MATTFMPAAKGSARTPLGPIVGLSGVHIAGWDTPREGGNNLPRKNLLCLIF